MKRLTTIGRTALTALASALLTMLIITACGGGPSGGPGGGNAARAFIFNSNPVGFHATSGFGPGRASISSPFVVNAATTTPGGGNFPGFCNAVALSTGRAATVLFGLGRWSSGVCDDGNTPDTSIGVAIEADGQVGQLTVDAVGQGNGADSGQMEVKIIHADGSQTIIPVTCTLGQSSAGAKVHCEDLNAAHNANVVKGDQLAARIFYNAGDQYNAIRVNVQYATPTF
jgi:hypothetical protein